MIGFLEQMQTQLDAEMKALPPQEQKAAQGPIDALQPRVAALSRRDVPLPPQPVVPPRILGFSPVYREPMGTTGPVAAPQVRFPAQTVPQRLFRAAGSDRFQTDRGSVGTDLVVRRDSTSGSAGPSIQNSYPICTR